MKILVINNIYPPMQIGGYEQLCSDVVEGLKRNGHTVCVLTSDCVVDGASSEDGIKRFLKLDMDFYGYRSIGPLRSRRYNSAVFRRLIDEFDPDVIFLWNLENLDRSLMNQAAATGRKVLYHLGSLWIIQDDAVTHMMRARPGFPVRNAVKALLRPIFRGLGMLYQPQENLLDNAIFSCCSLRDIVLSSGVRVKNDFVIHEGIALENLPERDWGVNPSSNKLKLLYAGQLVRHKGVHTAILAVDKLVRSGKSVSLTVIGNGEPEYIQYLYKLVETCGIAASVSFLPPVSRDKLGSIVIDHDILVFPSIWEEPWSLMLLIGMACGIAVVGTKTGGSREILVHGDNALVFPAGDETALADRIVMLDEDRTLLEKLGREAAKLVRQYYGINTMIDRVDGVVRRVGGKVAN